MRGLSAAVVATAWALTSACVEEREMSFVALPTTVGATKQTCADGSAAGFFIDESTADAVVNPNFVIWLGESELCNGETGCKAYCKSTCEEDASGGINSTNAECFKNELECSSKLWGALDVRPESMMCADKGSIFANYVRVFVPACTLDWFLGRGIASSTSDLHFGANVVDGVISTLLSNHGLDKATKVIVGGSGGGGIGAANSVRRITTAIKAVSSVASVEVLLVLDSSYLVLTPEFGVDDYKDLSKTYKYDMQLKQNSSSWLADAAFDTACTASWTTANAYKCLYVENIFTKDELRTQKTLIIQSQFDFDQLMSVNIASEAVRNSYTDEGGYFQVVSNFVQAFGVSQRESLAKVTDYSLSANALQVNTHVFSPACSQAAFLVPVAFLEQDYYKVQFGKAGSINLVRNASTWETIAIDKQSLEATLEKFVAGTLESQLVDSCVDFLCNELCPTTISSFTLSLKTDECQQTSVVVYCVFFVSVFFLMFAATIVRVCYFRAQTSLYWKSKAGSVGLETDIQEDMAREAAALTDGRLLHLMVENISYWAPTRKGKGICGSSTEAPFQILKNVSLSFQPGTVSALMGPSGSGKSTLLDILANARESGRMTGNHFINGVPSHISRASFLRQWLRNSVSYVRQQDVLFPFLTVRQHLEHAAWLMLPQFMPAKKKLDRVDQVLRLLELQGCADTICGDGGVRVEGGISGGQRRRVSIATQLLKMPTAILLDEPTSGLDSTNALLLVECLKNLAKKGGINVIMTIHQPRSEIFRLLDTLSILVKGRVVFSGTPDDAARTFQVDINEANVGDEILDMLQTSSKEQVDRYRAKYESGDLGMRVSESIENNKTEMTPQMALALRSVLVENALAEGRWSWTEATSTITTMWVLMSRVILRGGFDIFRTTSFATIGGVIVGLVFRKEPTYTSQTALAYLGVSTMTFLQSTFLGDRYNAEKQMWTHERDNGTNISWLAFLMCLFIRNIVTSTVEGFVFAVPIYFMGGMHTLDESFSLDLFLNYLVLMILTSIAVIVQNTTVEIDRIRRGGDTGLDTRQAVLINMSLLALSALFNGFIIQLKDIPVVLRWVPYVMLTFWSFVGVLINNFQGRRFETNSPPLEEAQRTGDNWVRSFSYDSFDQYQCMFALLVLIIGLHILSLLIFYLRFAHNTSKLKRGRPSNAGKDDGTSSLPATPRIGRGSSAKELLKSSKDSTGAAVGSRGKVLTALLSRENLVAFFIFDLLMAWTVCLFRPSTESTQTSLSGSSLVNATSSLLSVQSVKLDNVSVGFILFNTAFFCVYVLQFLIQIGFLVPLSGDGKRKSIVWFSIFDLLGLPFLVLDAGLLLAFFVVGYADIGRSLLFIAGNRFARYCFVTCYWLKVNSFHRSRANQFKRNTENEFLAPAEEFNLDAEPTFGHTNSKSSHNSNFAPPGRFNRISGMFSSVAPPPPPARVSMESRRFRDLDLGPQWRAFQRQSSTTSDFEV